jgi:hypothetical protein
MGHHSLPIGTIAIAFGLLANAAPAQAAAATWISGTGSNTGSCPITSPCRSLQFAHGQTNPGGTINVLSAGSFGSLTITKSVSIVADGIEALIHGGGSIGAGIKIQAGAGDIISLRGLTIDLRGTNNVGIDFVSGAALHVHNSVIRGTTDGISFMPASGAGELYVADTVIADSSARGIRVEPGGSGGAKVMLDRVRVENAPFSSFGIIFSGFSTSGSINATVRDSITAGNAIIGIVASENGSGTTNVMIDRSASLENTTGIQATNAGATIQIGDSTVTRNSTGLKPFSGGVINSYGTNKVNGNTNDGAATNTIPMK